MARPAVIAVIIGAVLPGVAVAAIAGAGFWFGGAGSTSFALAGLPERTVHNYHFVESQPQMFGQVPCYCGCYAYAHRSLLDCFVRPEGGYEPHASECGICGREADDVERMMLDRRMPPREIRGAIESAYAEYGEPTNTP